MDENEKKEVIDITPEESKKETTTEKVAKEEKSNGTNKDKKGLAIAAMVLGIVSLVLFCIWYISLPCAILAIIFGIISIKSSKRGMAIAGISTGAVGAILMILLYVLAFVLILLYVLAFVLIGVGTSAGVKEIIENFEDYQDDYDYHYNSFDDLYENRYDDIL